MDIKTIILALAIGNFIFGLTLIFYSIRDTNSQKNYFLIAAKFLQLTGWLMLYFRGSVPDLLSFTVGNIFLLSGFKYECWSMFKINGKYVSLSLQILSLIFITCICVYASALNPPLKIALSSSISVIIFFLSAWVMLRHGEDKSFLRSYVGWTMLILATTVTVRAILALPIPDGFYLFTQNPIQLISFFLLYFVLLTNGFGLILISKEQSDKKLHEVMEEQKAILDTLPTGLCILRDRIIDQCNPAMEQIFGFLPGMLKGKSVRILYENDEIFEEYGYKIYSEIEKKGRFEGEVPYIRQNGEHFWAKDLGSTIFQERSQGHAVFSVTDISEQKKQQEILTKQKLDLEQTLSRINRLEGILSICMYCKKIRVNDESWEQLEKYITSHSDVHFSHGICPSCYEENYKSLKLDTD